MMGPWIESSASRPAGVFAFLGGGIAWTAHLLLAYAVSEFGCVAGLDQRTFAGLSAVSWMLLGVSAAMALLAGWATVVGYRMARWEPHAPSDSAGAYLARAGAITSGIFLLIILVQSIPIFFYLGRC